MDDGLITQEWVWPMKGSPEPFTVLAIRNGGGRCHMCGAYSARDWMFSFTEVDPPPEGKALVFCSDCWKGFLEMSLRLYLRLTKGKCKVKGILVPKDTVGPLMKEMK